MNSIALLSFTKGIQALVAAAGDRAGMQPGRLGARSGQMRVRDPSDARALLDSIDVSTMPVCATAAP
jgi:hypothetical protein